MHPDLLAQGMDIPPLQVEPDGESAPCRSTRGPSAAYWMNRSRCFGSARWNDGMIHLSHTRSGPPRISMHGQRQPARSICTLEPLRTLIAYDDGLYTKNRQKAHDRTMGHLRICSRSLARRAHRDQIRGVGARFATDDFDLVRLMQFCPTENDRGGLEQPASRRRRTKLGRGSTILSAPVFCALHPGTNPPRDNTGTRRRSLIIVNRGTFRSAETPRPRPVTALDLMRLRFRWRRVSPASHGLPALLGARRSRRAWSADPMMFTAFSNFLALCARDRESPEDTPFISRPHPSGGGIYSLEIYPVLAEQAVESISSGLYRYLPESHRLQTLPAAGAICSSYLESAGASAVAAPPPIVRPITSHFAAQAAIYGGLAYSLILKEVGSLFQTMYLAAEILHLSGPLEAGFPAVDVRPDFAAQVNLRNRSSESFCLGQH